MVPEGGLGEGTNDGERLELKNAHPRLGQGCRKHTNKVLSSRKVQPKMHLKGVQKATKHATK